MSGVQHEHQTVPGVVEDVHQIIQRLKALVLVLAPEVDEAVLHLRRKGAGAVRARDIEPMGSVRIVNPDDLLFTLQDDREISVELFINKGRGYLEADQHPVDKALPVDLVRIDSIYAPVRRANFTVAETRVGQRTDFDRLVLTVETNGTISPEDAVAYAAALTQHHLSYFVSFGTVPTVAAESGAPATEEGDRLQALLRRPIDECGLSVRSVNSLKNSSIHTLGDLVRNTEDQLLKVRNVGDRSIAEIAELLLKHGLNFGMQWEEAEGAVRITEPGTVPVVRPVPPEAEPAEEAEAAS